MVDSSEAIFAIAAFSAANSALADDTNCCSRGRVG